MLGEIVSPISACARTAGVELALVEHENACESEKQTGTRRGRGDVTRPKEAHACSRAKQQNTQRKRAAIEERARSRFELLEGELMGAFPAILSSEQQRRDQELAKGCLTVACPPIAPPAPLSASTASKAGSDAAKAFLPRRPLGRPQRSAPSAIARVLACSPVDSRRLEGQIQPPSDAQLARVVVSTLICTNKHAVYRPTQLPSQICRH